MQQNNPQFPLYIPSKSRADSRLTSKALETMKVPYYIVVEKEQYEDYAKVIDRKKILILDKKYQDEYNTCDDLGNTKSKGPGAARNFAWDHSIKNGYKWHWVMDDNIKAFKRYNKNKRIACYDGTPFKVMEDFVLRYKNISMAGPQYTMFVTNRSADKYPPFTCNTRIYSCNLIRNDVPFRWRGRYNEDTDLSLNMLKAGWCTIQFNAFLQEKITTQVVKGGNTEAFYDGEGTLPKSKMQVALHPDVSKLKWRYGRWHHIVDYNKFKRDNRLIKKDNLEIKEGINNYGLKLFKKNNDIIKIDLTKQDFFNLCKNNINITTTDLDKEIKIAIQQFNNNERDIGKLGQLENKWYKSLDKKPDYSVYADDFYFADIFRCWHIYSRKYLLDIQKPHSLHDRSIINDLKDVKNILDLGCGIGFTTANLKLLFTEAKVIGTNIKDTPQYEIASKLAKERDFKIIDDYKEIKTDLIFASEYFEHIENPVEHLLDIIKKCKPKYFLIANTFTQPAIGHFNNYKHLDKIYEGKEMSKLFNRTLKENNYIKIKTQLWNQKPNYWKLNENI